MGDSIQLFFNIAVALIGALGGWWMHIMWDSLKELERADRTLTDRVAEIRELVAGTYVKREHFEGRVDALEKILFDKLDRIEGKLDNKADKGR